MKLKGRILFLTEDAELLRQQIEEAKDIVEQPALHYGVNIGCFDDIDIGSIHDIKTFNGANPSW